MRKWLSFLLAAFLAVTLAACGAQPEAEAQTTPTEAQQSAATETTPQILIVYFSATGNTKPIAETIADLTNGDLFEIVPAEPYTSDDLNYNNDSCRANQEQNDASIRPEISATVENMDEYDIVLLGHPIWWYVAPTIINTFLEAYDFSGKKLVLCATSGGSGFGKTVESLRPSVPQPVSIVEGKMLNGKIPASELKAWADRVK